MQWCGVVMLVLAACDSGQRDPVRAAPVRSDAQLAASQIADASVDAAPVREHINHQLVAMQAQLGRAASTCAGTAKLLASQGQASLAKLVSRERRILKLCVHDKWPEAMRHCVAQATHDPMSCTDNLETAKQKASWNVVFESW